MSQFQTINTTLIEADIAQPVVSNQALTVGVTRAYSVHPATIGSAASVTRQIGLGLKAAFTGATYNAFICDEVTPSFTQNYFIYQDPTSTRESIFYGPVTLNGNLGLGAGDDADAKLFISGTSTSTAASQFGLLANHIGNSSATTSYTEIQAAAETQAASFTCALLRNFNAAAMTKGSGCTVTRAVNFYGTNQTVGTNNAFVSDSNSFVGNFFIFSSSTNVSQLAGLLGVKQATDNVTDALPTQAEMVTALGAANQGTGMIGFIKDANADTNFFLCATNGTSWYAIKLTKGA